MAGLPREDAALTSLITELVMRAESEPASEGAMQLNFDLLEQQRLEDGISAAQKAGDYEVEHAPLGRAGRSSRTASPTRASSASPSPSFHILGTPPRVLSANRPAFGTFSGPIHPAAGGKCLQMDERGARALPGGGPLP